MYMEKSHMEIDNAIVDVINIETLGGEILIGSDEPEQTLIKLIHLLQIARREYEHNPDDKQKIFAVYRDIANIKSLLVTRYMMDDDYIAGL